MEWEHAVNYLKNEQKKIFFPLTSETRVTVVLAPAFTIFFVDVSVEIPAIFYACAKRDRSDF